MRAKDLLLKDLTGASKETIGSTSHLSRLRRIEGKLDMLRVEWTKCDRKGRYSVAKLIENTAAGAT